MLDLSQIALFFICALTSAFTASVGVGGGVILLAILPNFLAPAIVIPIHGATQLMSNVSRFVFDWRMVRWDLVKPYLPGALLGGLVGFYFLDVFQFDYLPLILAVFILLCTWTDLVVRLGVVLGNMFFLGGVQTFLSLFVGAIGLIVPPILFKKGLNKDAVIATQSVFMSGMHGFKVAAYVAAGFAFREHWVVMVLMLVGSSFGSYIGQRWRNKIPEQAGIRVMKWLITALALQLIVSFVLSFRV